MSQLEKDYQAARERTRAALAGALSAMQIGHYPARIGDFIREAADFNNNAAYFLSRMEGEANRGN